MDYHLKPVGKICAATGEEMQPGETCHTVLVERGGALERLDYSTKGFPGVPEEAYGYWKCTVPAHVPTRAKPIDADALMRYFEQLSEDANPAQERFRYLLALLLLQKRRLRIEGSRKEDNVEWLELVGLHGEGQFSVRDEQLADEEIEQLQAQLTAHLAAEWT